MRSLLTILKNILNKLSSIDSKKAEMKLLWTNGSPSSNFAAQTISLNLTPYDMVLIIYRHTLTSERYSDTIIPKGKDGLMMSLDYENHTGHRSAVVSGSGVEFSTCAFSLTGNIVNRIIPYHIYGIKLGGGTN